MNSENKIVLFGKTFSELQALVTELDMPKFTAKQIASWLYKKAAKDIAQMTDISLANRQKLESTCQVGLREAVSSVKSSDGTRKYLFHTDSNFYIEAAYIPDRERATLCVSSQAGCRMGCLFCMTGRQGLKGNLTSGEIVNQIASLPECDTLTNVVYMGMGEPLDNVDEVLKSIEILTSEWGYGWSPTRITLSTVGYVPTLRRFMDESKAHLAVSLHNPFNEQRLEIMPIESAYSIKDVIGVLKSYDFSGQRRVSFEYIVMAGLNDSSAHVRELARLLDGLKCRINLIRFHKIPGSPYFSPSDREMEAFRDALTRKGIITTIRSSRGEDIQAACGLLSTEEMDK